MSQVREVPAARELDELRAGYSLAQQRGMPCVHHRCGCRIPNTVSPHATWAYSRMRPSKPIPPENTRASCLLATVDPGPGLGHAFPGFGVSLRSTRGIQQVHRRYTPAQDMHPETGLPWISWLAVTFCTTRHACRNGITVRDRHFGQIGWTYSQARCRDRLGSAAWYARRTTASVSVVTVSPLHLGHVPLGGRANL